MGEMSRSRCRFSQIRWRHLSVGFPPAYCLPYSGIRRSEDRPLYHPAYPAGCLALFSRSSGSGMLPWIIRFISCLLRFKAHSEARSRPVPSRSSPNHFGWRHSCNPLLIIPCCFSAFLLSFCTSCSISVRFERLRSWKCTKSGSCRFFTAETAFVCPS